jgi:hypothetical protein
MSTVGGGVNIVTDGLVLYLDAANTKSYPGSGTTWTDVSKGGNNGTLTNGPTFNSANGGSIVFDGVNDTVNCGNILNIGLNSLTVSCWVKINSGTGIIGVIGKTSARSYVGRYSIFIETNNILAFFQPADNKVIQTPVTPYIDGKFHNITMVIDRVSFMRLYIDSISVGTPIDIGATSNINLSNSTDNLYIGSYGSSNGQSPIYFLNGSIPIVSIYNRALTAQEVLQNYNATKTRFGL